MFSRKILLCGALCLLLCFAVSAADAQTMYNAQYCFSEEDFRTNEGEVDGIFVTAVPDASVAVVRLDNRTICPGDVLSAQSLERLTLVPNSSENCTAVIGYQPICGKELMAPAQVTVRIQNGKNETPTVSNVTFETYKNIANDGKLSATDPEGGQLTYQIVDQPKRGDVKLSDDGTFLYTPKHNKVGEDRFTYTATDDAGNVSKPATVSIRILNPTEKMSFSDMNGDTGHFEAMWMLESGLYGGKTVGTKHCFCPNDTVSRSEFLVMAMELLEIEPQADAKSAFADEKQAPAWMQPYVATAAQKGLIRGRTDENFCPNEAITAQEAAVMLQNILNLPVPASAYRSGLPAWSAKAVLALSDAGICADYKSQNLTYAQAAGLLYQISKL